LSPLSLLCRLGKRKRVYTDRCPKFCYTPKGKEVREKLWRETIEELNFAGTSKIVESLEKKFT
jgi:hypothetical protein